MIKINFMRKLLILLLSALSLTTLAQEKQVAILEPVAVTNEVSLMHRSMVRGEMVKAIGRQEGYAAFTRTDIDKIVNEQNFQQSGMVDDDTRIRIGDMKGVDYLCVTKVSKEGNNYYMEAVLVHVESGEITQPATQFVELSGGSLANLLTACENLAAELVGVKYTDKETIATTQSYAQTNSQSHTPYAPNQNDLKQQYKKGLDYYEGRNGVDKNFIMAISYFQKAAEQGLAEAQCDLGTCYIYGNGVTENYEIAVFWYRKAAEQGDARAQCNLGLCYSKGYGVPQDDNLAVNWYRKAAEQGFAGGQYNLGVSYRKGLGVPQDDNLAVNWYRKAAAQGDASAQYGLGWHYEYGKGVAQDNNIAYDWYSKAAIQGHKQAKNALERLKQ